VPARHDNPCLTICIVLVMEDVVANWNRVSSTHDLQVWGRRLSSFALRMSRCTHHFVLPHAPQGLLEQSDTPELVEPADGGSQRRPRWRVVLLGCVLAPRRLPPLPLRGLAHTPEHLTPAITGCSWQAPALELVRDVYHSHTCAAYRSGSILVAAAVAGAAILTEVILKALPQQTADAWLGPMGARAAQGVQVHLHEVPAQHHRYRQPPEGGSHWQGALRAVAYAARSDCYFCLAVPGILPVAIACVRAWWLVLMRAALRCAARVRVPLNSKPLAFP
jgi:hypothetical protein